jgi:ABC transporter substrate binding protein
MEPTAYSLRSAPASGSGSCPPFGCIRSSGGKIIESAMSATHRRYAGEQREARPLWCSAVGLIVALALSLCATPCISPAQPSGHIPRIGFLSGSALTPELARGLDAFRYALREHGWVEGHNLAIESRFAEGQFERLPTLAAELVGLHVDVIVTEGSEGVQAAQHATQTIPIVMRSVAEPVQRGLIASLARPGGNITGLAGASGDLNGKRLELLKEAMPTLTRMAVLWNPPQRAHCASAGGLGSRWPGLDSGCRVAGERPGGDAWPA